MDPDSGLRPKLAQAAPPSRRPPPRRLAPLSEEATASGTAQAANRRPRERHLPLAVGVCQAASAARAATVAVADGLSLAVR
jgi:hypothetical protein